MVLPPFDPWRSGAVALDVAATTWGSRRGVLDRQQRRLAALLAGAAAHCPAYRERLGRAVKGYFERIPDPADHPVFRIETGVETQGADR